MRRFGFAIKANGQNVRRISWVGHRASLFNPTAARLYSPVLQPPASAGKMPDLVRQEFHGLMMAHFAVRSLMHDAALRAHLDPDRLSFLHAMRVARRKLPLYGAIPPSGPESQEFLSHMLGVRRAKRDPNSPTPRHHDFAESHGSV
jgi:hypothetical protein